MRNVDGSRVLFERDGGIMWADFSEEELKEQNVS